MKYLITESKLKTLVNYMLGFDLTGNIELEPSIYKVLNDFDECVSYENLSKRQSSDNYGPMYLITIDDNYKILYQKNLITGLDWIISNRCDSYDESDFMNLLEIRPIGITMDEFVNLYV